MSALAFAAVGGLWWQLGVALSADHFLALVGSGQGSQRWLDLDATETATSQSEHQVEGGLLLDVVVGKGATVLQLLSSEDQSLLVWWDTFFILNLGPNHKQRRNGDGEMCW